MALTKIETGMKQGPEAIQKNFEALYGNDEVHTGAATSINGTVGTVNYIYNNRALFLWGDIGMACEDGKDAPAEALAQLPVDAVAGLPNYENVIFCVGQGPVVHQIYIKRNGEIGQYQQYGFVGADSKYGGKTRYIKFSHTIMKMN